MPTRSLFWLRKTGQSSFSLCLATLCSWLGVSDFTRWSASCSLAVSLLWSSPLSHLRAQADDADECSFSLASSSPSFSDFTEELDDEERDELEEETEELEEETELEEESEELLEETLDDELDELDNELELPALVVLELSDETTDELELAVPLVSSARIALAVFQTKSEEMIMPVKPSRTFLVNSATMFFIGKYF